MKFLVLCCVIVSALSAELPRLRPARFRTRFQRIELAPTTTDPPTEGTTEQSGIYPPSGWKPAGEPFNLPNKQPADSYGAPQESGPYPPSGWKPNQPFELPQPDTGYGVPDNTYGAPEATTTEAPTTTENPQPEKLEGPVEVQKSIGTYYVLLPNGQLQKVEFATENDVQNMRYTASVQLSDRAPLLVFRP